MRLRDTEDYLDFLLSPRSLRLHEEYESRINVLKKLTYIDDENLGESCSRKNSFLCFQLQNIFP